MPSYSKWVQFTWDLTQLPGQAPVLDKRYQVNLATPDDGEMLDACFSRSYSMEQGWSSELKGRVEAIRQLLATALPAGTMDFIVIRHGQRIIAASCITDELESSNHLPAGVCVLNEYRCRGLGGFLLYESLRQLKEKGLRSVRAVTKKGVTAERYLYPKFGSVRQVYQPEMV